MAYLPAVEPDDKSSKWSLNIGNITGRAILSVEYEVATANLSARLGSARLGSARLGSARLGSARLSSSAVLFVASFAIKLLTGTDTMVWLGQAANGVITFDFDVGINNQAVFYFGLYNNTPAPGGSPVTTIGQVVVPQATASFNFNPASIGWAGSTRVFAVRVTAYTQSTAICNLIVRQNNQALQALDAQGSAMNGNGPPFGPVPIGKFTNGLTLNMAIPVWA
jgi:hypothetical protein